MRKINRWIKVFMKNNNKVSISYVILFFMLSAISIISVPVCLKFGIEYLLISVFLIFITGYLGLKIKNR
ncbi:MAG TPA: hypothetical protein DEF85_02455 [Clostridiaceae bacterium]|jgi:hypothetical protein|nr:hypothetical protein [Clostridiaceae bacterium]HBG38267.1 hypothetical protein [Clostridiaceae bacterium]HBN28786.1 hypothetical protein [Clostridiaceae bacterium]HBX47737.1 hypothetical protein [Clostridiaceae bacterium]